MKKRLIVILFIACLFLLTGCKKNDYVGGVFSSDVEYKYEDAVAKYESTTYVQNRNLIGFLSTVEYDVPQDSLLLSGRHYVFYQAGSTLPAGEYYAVYSTQEEKCQGHEEHEHIACPECGLCVDKNCTGTDEEKCPGHEPEPEHEHIECPQCGLCVDANCDGTEEEIAYPEIEIEGMNYAGYFKADGTRITTQAKDSMLFVRYISFADAGLVVVVCVAIVFAMLALLCGIVTLFKYIAPKANKTENKKEDKPVVQKQQIKLEDIKDEDMMVAVLVASIDYHEETQQDVRVVSVKEL